MTILLDLPMTLVRACSPNKRQHHMVLAKNKGALKDYVRWTLRTKRHRTYDAATVHLFAIGKKRWDPDNLVASCKAAIDAFEAEGIVTNDQHIQLGTVRSIAWPKGVRGRLHWTDPDRVCIRLEP